MLEGQLSDPRIALCYVTEVEMNPGNKSARVYIAVDGGEQAEADTVAALVAAKGYIRHELLTRLGVRRVPDLSFHVDKSEKFQSRIDELLGRVQKRKKAAAGAAEKALVANGSSDKDQHQDGSDQRWKRLIPDSQTTVTPDPTQISSIKDLEQVGQTGGLLPILEALRLGERFLVCSHSRPDGDAVGSMLAMGMLLKQMGKRVEIVSADRVPAIYRCLPGADQIQTAMRVRGPYDAVLLLECDGLERTRLLGLDHMFLINIDHHASGKNFGQLNWIDYDACSVGELVHRLVKSAGAVVTPQMATCLYTTLLTDTGGFCYGGIQPRTFYLAAELTSAGADPVRIAREVYFATPISKMKLLGQALHNLHREGELAWLWVTHDNMVEFGASEEDCEGIVNYALSIAGVEVAVFLRELPEGRIRLSLRSKTAGDRTNGNLGALNVAAIAEKLGGGGHQNAAGCTLDGPMPRATSEILKALTQVSARNAQASPD